MSQRRLLPVRLPRAGFTGIRDVLAQKLLCKPSVARSANADNMFKPYCGDDNATTICAGDIVQIRYVAANYSTEPLTLNANYWFSTDEDWQQTDAQSSSAAGYWPDPEKSIEAPASVLVPDLTSLVGKSCYLIVRLTAETTTGTIVHDSIPMRGLLTVTGQLRQQPFIEAEHVRYSNSIGISQAWDRRRPVVPRSGPRRTQADPSAMLSPAVRYAVGDRIDNRYEVRSVLASGGMADVYRATDCQTNRDVVLKLPQTALAGDLAAFNRYQREIEIARGLDHPGLQRLLSDPNAPYLVFEYVDGESLRSYLKRHPGGLPIEEAQHIGVQLADTLQYVHDQGIVHRDLKPENILIGPDGHVTLTDFGIALRLASRRLTFSHLSNAVGTPDYMAPEQVRGERGDARTDVYALGCLLFELLTGRVPYPADQALEAMRRKVETEPPLVRQLRPDAPPAIEAVVYRALRRRPSERYASMAELAHDLQHLEEVAIPEAYLPDEPPPKPLGDLPPWRTTLTVLLIILVILLAVGFAAQFAHRATPSP